MGKWKNIKIEYKNDTSKIIIKSYTNGNWGVFIDKSIYEARLLGTFTSKKEAIDYAMKYMRSHPNG